MARVALARRFARAYGEARYEVKLPYARLVIHPGERVRALDKLLRRHGARCWCFITAHNPGSRLLPPWRNAARAARLRRRVRSLRVYSGSGGGPGWPQEPSLLLLDMDARRALRLARDFHQNAVLVGELGRAARLMWCR